MGAEGEQIDGMKVKADSPAFSELASAIARIRRKLLDLSLRNPLLGFPKRRTAIRAVGEMPDQLFRQLTDGAEMQLRAVPKPRGAWLGGSDKTDDRDRDSTEDAAPNPETAPDRVRWFGRDRASKAKGTEAGGLPVAEAARIAGIDPEFDLPLIALPSPLEANAAFTDRYIQTLLYPEDLARIGAKLVNESRLLLEETGSNLLQLSFGALEWKDLRDGKSRFAPLILLPVALTKAVGGKHEYTFTLRQADEDPVANVSLQEKMREDFGLVMPEFGEDDTPANFFSAVQQAIQSKPEWSVRGHVTLALLEFGKILMYKDLDPEDWPEGEAPHFHPLIQRLFAQVGDSEPELEGSIDSAPIKDVDAEMALPAAPLLIRDADSSQCSAILDALAGKSLVIQGPPGTGKSQTIANLIAAAISRGLRVLFVAEKRAALEVVHNRLVDAGLGPFLLELHSDRAKKKAIAEHLSARIELVDEFKPAQGLQDHREELKRQQQQLGNYAKLLGQPVGALGVSLHTLIWETRRARRALGPPADKFETIEFDGVSSWSMSQAKETREHLDRLSLLLPQVLAQRAPDGRHSWDGVNPEHVTGLDLPALRAPFAALRGSSHEFLVAEEALGGYADTAFLLTPSTLADISTTAKRLAEVSAPLLPHLLPKLRELPVEGRVRSFVLRVNESRAGKAAVELRWPAAFRHLHHYAMVGSRLSDIPPLPSAATVAGISDHRRAWLEAETKCRLAAGLIAQLGSVRPVWLDPTVADLFLIEDVLGQLVGLDRDAAGKRHEALRSPGAVETLASIGDTLAALRGKNAELEKRLRLDLGPDLGEVRRHIRTLAGTPWWRRLGAAYRNARRVHRSISRSQRVSHIAAVDDFENLSRHLANLSRFASNEEYAGVLGRWSRGLETPIDTLSKLANWGRALDRASGAYPGRSDSLRSLWQVEEALYLKLQGAANDDRTVAACRDARSALAAIGVCDMTRDGSTLLADLSDSCATAAEALGSASDTFKLAELPDELPVSTISALLHEAEAVFEVGRRIGDDVDMGSLIEVGFDGVDTNLDPLIATLQTATMLRDILGGHPFSDYLWSPDFASRRDLLNASVALADRTATTLQEVESLLLARLGTNAADWYGDDSSQETRPLRHLGERAGWAESTAESLPVWLAYCHARRSAVAVGLERLVVLAEGEHDLAAGLPVAFDFVLRNSLILYFFRHNQDLLHLRADTLEAARGRFAHLDRQLILANRDHVAHLASRRQLLAGRDWGPVATHTEFALVQREAGKERRHIAIRQLIARAGRTLQALCPCWMMSPISIARFCEPGEVDFDLVIMDESSQLRPEDTLGAIARGKQIVVVGDPKQLPPTSFFDVTVGGDDDAPPPEEDLAQGITESESILDVAGAAFRPMRLLKWHYRSQHESLIAFSNNRFYGDRLIVFPSPYGDVPGLGVHFEFVSNAIYSNSLNPREAERVGQLIGLHCRNQPERSLGIVTMNAHQRDRIQDLLDQAVLDDPAVRAFVESREGSLDSLIIKNLENIQGDERDVIIISVTYGPDVVGNVYQRFGPINEPAGPRRLNVLFTRARQQVVVVSSMRAGDIQADASTSEGTQVLKAYLEYAETGRFSQVGFSGREPDSPFECEVAEELRNRGYEVVAQLGVAGYYLDLAVRHPERPGEYVIAVECDGATYHSSRSARDRDRLRQQQLEALGWKIHRIWSTDWFFRPQAELNRLLSAIGRVRS
ncbi:MAG: DUF4011 domain-containing protein [Gemmatimonadales bacterium]|nr:DUF4011 domain-containing protein [Gemmatimonadales bacterium]